jgi:ceramide glucosyltransferase
MTQFFNDSMIQFLYLLLSFLILQGVISLLEGIRFYRFVKRSLRDRGDSFTPPTTVVAPCKGLDPNLDTNIDSLFDQDYPDYDIVFVVASAGDPACGAIERAMSSRPGRLARLVIASPSPHRGEKVSNLIAGILHARRESEAFVFVDSDVRVRRDWLKALVSPLASPAVGAATGYRWYLPNGGEFWAALLSAWNGSVATTLGDHHRNFAWGGSTAILRTVFEEIDVRSRWENALSDDYALTAAVREAGLRIVFVPRCLTISVEDVGLSSLIEFTTRQIIITRVYRPSVWWVGMVTNLMFVVGFFGGLAVVAMPGGFVNDGLTTALLLFVVFLLGLVKGALRLTAARTAIKDAPDRVTRLWWMFCLLWPIVSLVFLFNFLKSATTRRIRWRGVCYEMRSPTETVIVGGGDEVATTPTAL